MLFVHSFHFPGSPSFRRRTGRKSFSTKAYGPPWLPLPDRFFACMQKQSKNSTTVQLSLQAKASSLSKLGCKTLIADQRQPRSAFNPYVILSCTCPKSYTLSDEPHGFTWASGYQPQIEMSYSLTSLKGAFVRDDIGDYYPEFLRGTLGV